MDILGIGPLELVLILVIVLLVFGPDKLPEIGAKMGKGVRELRQLSREISAGVNTITEPMDELRKLLPVQNNSAALNIANVCRRVMEDRALQ